MLKALGYRIIVEVPEVEERTAGGIILAQQTREADENAQEWGTVIDIGPCAYKEYKRDEWCKVGDVVSFAKYAGKIVTDRKTGKKYRVINDLDVLVSEVPDIDCIFLSEEASQVVWEAIENPPEPNDALRRAMDRRRDVLTVTV